MVYQQALNCWLKLVVLKLDIIYSKILEITLLFVYYV